MERVLTALSMGLGVGSFVYSFAGNIYTSLLFCALTIILICVSFFIESEIKAHGNDFVNKLMYYISRDEYRYNIENERCTYSYLGNGEYECEKRISIKLNANDVDYIEERYSWTSDSKSANLLTVNSNDNISHIHKDGLWTCYTIDLGGIRNRNEVYQTGSKITNLIDPNGEALPFYSTYVTKKTKVLIITVKFPKDQLPSNDVYFHSKPTDDSKAISTKPEILEYDATRGGYSKTVHFPRKGWQYVISWGKK